MYDWNTLATPTLHKSMMFKKEMFNDVVNHLWANYGEKKDSRECVAALLSLIEDYPDIKTLFDKYYADFEDEFIWSDIVLRFMRKLSIAYENYEIQTANV